MTHAAIIVRVKIMLSERFEVVASGLLTEMHLILCRVMVIVRLVLSKLWDARLM